MVVYYMYLVIYQWIIVIFLDCPDGWMWFEDNCYMLFSSPQPLSWFAAEEVCVQDHGCHLVSITNREEMIFLHYLLTTEWKTNDTRTFIGKSYD